MAAVLRSRAHTVYRLLPACMQFMNTSDCMRAGWGLPMVRAATATFPLPAAIRPDALPWRMQTLPTNHNRVVVRRFSEELRVVTSTMGEADYHHVADKTLDMMAEKLEVFVEDQEVPDGDIEYSQGVLTVKLGRHGTFVINKQTPNRQIWLSSPVSGPYRFDYVDGRWIYNRDGRDLVQQLEQEIGALLRSELHLE